MYYNLADTRQRLPEGTRVESDACVYLIDRYIGSGGFALMYLAHQEGAGHYVALKELFPDHVENAVAERREDGRIVIHDPLTGNPETDDRPEIWEELAGCLQREVELTRKAGRVYDRSGKRELQNSADVLQISDLFQDARGNRYVAIDTAQGESLRERIRQGFLKTEDGTIIGNGRLKEILQILEETTKLLDHLHGDNHMLHLDLSPDNIWLTSSMAGTRMTPHIIDYGSAYDLENREMDHRFTCNPWSAPEIMALAELNDQEAGYQADESSDTYAIVSILFWAVTGELFFSGLRYNRSWRDRIQEAYDPGVPDKEESFGERLIALLEKGLSSDQTLRYRTAADLLADLTVLRSGYPASGTYLPEVGEDELMSYVLLDRWPLYAYRGENGDMDVLCLGSGSFVQRMILSILSVGQMIDSHLNIHVVSSDPEDEVRRMLLNKAPALPEYSNLEGSRGEQEYVSFTFDRVKDLLDPETCARIAREYAFCHYVVISLGRNSRNIDLARMVGKELSALDLPEEQNTVIHYYMCEDAAGNVRSSVSEEGISGQVQLEPFGNDVAACADAIRSLGRLTLRLNYLYCKLDDPTVALRDTVGGFLKDGYGQRSSCASAVHLRYKLASVGISTARQANHRSVVNDFRNAMEGPQRGKLLELEHRRWLMYMVSDGYRLPSMDQLESYAFRTVNGKFNGAFKNKTEKFHHCLVPCDTRGVCLPRDHGEWDRYESFEEIDEAPFDPLDRMSLKVHLIARRRVENPATGQELKSDFANRIVRALDRWEQRMIRGAEKAASEGAMEEAQKRVKQLRQHCQDVEKALDGVIRTCRCTDEQAQVRRLEEDFLQEGISDADFRLICNELEIYREFSACKDYKAPDETISENLLWLLYAGDPITLIKLAGRSVVSNITGPLILEPDQLIYFGMEHQEGLKTFLYHHGNRGRIRFQPCRATGAEEVTRALERLRAGIPGRVVLDITDSGEILTAAAIRLAQAVRNTAVVRSNERSQTLENIQGFGLAGAYRLHNSISAEEVYRLYGAREIQQKDQDYIHKLDQVADGLWEFYQKYGKRWDRICGFFALRCEGTPELRVKLNPDSREWSTFRTPLFDFEWKQLKLKDCFEQMEQEGLIRALQIRTWSGPCLELSFEYPGNASDLRNGKSFAAFFQNRKSSYALVPYECRIEGTIGERQVSVGSGSMVEISDLAGTEVYDRPSGLRVSYSSMVPVLQDLETMGLIRNLTIQSPNQTPVNIRFAYTNLAVRDCLLKAGNILQLYAWHCARRTGWFDDCRANLSFRWKEGLENELDLILTRGLTTLVVSCRTDRVGREQLYEIRYLTDRFSLNSTPVIICASLPRENGEPTEETAQLLRRASAMGVCLLDASQPGDLGQQLKDIATGAWQS